MPLKSLDATKLLEMGWHPATPFREALLVTFQAFCKANTKTITPEQGMKRLTQKARQLRLKMVQMCAQNGGHIASALSCIDIMVALYYGDVFKFNPQNPAWD